MALFRQGYSDLAKKVIYKYSNEWADREVFVVGSTLLTTDLTLGSADAGITTIPSISDPITAAMARYCLGEPIGFRPRNPERHHWMLKYCDGNATPEEELALVRISWEIFQFLDRPAPFYRRQTAHYLDNLDKHIATCVEKTAAAMEVLKKTVVRYEEQNAIRFVRHKADGPIVVFPQEIPRDFRRYLIAYDEKYIWRNVRQREWDQARWGILVEEVANHPEWVIVSEKEEPTIEEFAVGKAMKNRRQPPHWIYARKLGQERRGRGYIHLPPKQKVQQLPYPIQREMIDSKKPIDLLKVDAVVFNSYRSIFLDRKIASAGASRCYLVMQDGHVLGGFGMDPQGNAAGRSFTAEWCDIYAMCDFGVEPTATAKLSKLVVMMMLSKEVMDDWQQFKGRKVEYLGSTAFSQHPESMKYRGIMQLFKRIETPPGKGNAGEKYRLNYRAKMGQWTVKEGFARWLKKYADASTVK